MTAARPARDISIMATKARMPLVIQGNAVSGLAVMAWMAVSPSQEIAAAGQGRCTTTRTASINTRTTSPSVTLLARTVTKRLSL